MSGNPDISLELIDPATMKPVRADLERASNRVFKPVFNGAGSFSLDVPLDSEAAYLVHKRSTGILFNRNSRPIWSGGVTNISKDAEANRCSIVATGWLEEFEHRQVWPTNEATLQFGTATVGGTIIHAIINAINSQTDTSGVVRPVRITPGSVGDTQTRTGSYRRGDNALAKIKELVEIENGCDIDVDPLTFKLNTRSSTSYTNRTGLQFGWGISPNNLKNCVEVDDGADQASRVSVVASNGVIYAADDPIAIADAGVMLESWQSLSGVSDPNIALAYANAELVFYRYGRQTFTLTPKTYGDIPRPYDNFEWGDVGYLSVDKGAFQLSSQAVRLFSATMTYDSSGTEIISDLQVTM